MHTKHAVRPYSYFATKTLTLRVTQRGFLYECTFRCVYCTCQTFWQLCAIVRSLYNGGCLRSVLVNSQVLNCEIASYFARVSVSVHWKLLVTTSQQTCVALKSNGLSIARGVFGLWSLMPEASVKTVKIVRVSSFLFKIKHWPTLWIHPIECYGFLYRYTIHMHKLH